MKPSIVATVSNFADLKSSVKEAAALRADFVEFRIDAFPLEQQKNISTLLREIQSENSLGIIATVRAQKEQGPHQTRITWTELERHEIFESVLPFVDLIDIELSSDKINSSIIRKAHQMKKGVILSYHDFNSIPNEKKLKQLLLKFHRLNGDIFKVAAMPKNEEELLQFLTLGAHLKNIQKVFIAMGEIGKLSRIKAFSLGSCLTYGYVGKPMAPGQTHIKQLCQDKEL